jgi:hypothetical protein
VRLAAALLLLTACGPRWTDADAKSATDAVHVQLAIEAICADGGACTPAQVRALERASLCANAAQLFRHGQSVPTGSVKCQP